MNLDTFGGRKFVAMLVGILAGTAVEILSQKGLSVELAGLIGVLVGTFTGANAFVTKGALKLEGEAPSEASATLSTVDTVLHEKMDANTAVTDATATSVKSSLEAILQSQANLQKGLAALITGRIGGGQ